ncbi:tetratricopeptide repeat protein [Streptomyces sp. WAC 06783]|uniref:tetratricopeptide repeat protein n=1 Tax=Streptomyces sp. WAC 06783 TaxID=2203211 RepID=UPI00289B602D|nr:tetratricopeptide repeat protein [Streptomyces sp. WAC 06783]
MAVVPMSVAELTAVLAGAARRPAEWRAVIAELGAALPAPGNSAADLLDRATTAPEDQLPVRELAALAADLARENPGLAEFLAALRHRMTLAAPDARHTANVIKDSTAVTGHVIQAGAIHGDVHLPPAAGPRPVPRQLLGTPPHFTDRTADLEALDTLRAGHLATGPLLIAVTGPAGVGKTTLVSHWLRGLTAHYPDGQLYADLGAHAPGGPVRPGEVLGAFLRALGAGQVPAETAEQAALWRTLTAGLRIAVMLDNAVSAAQVRTLLPGAAGSLVVAAGRSRLTGLGVDGAVFHELGTLDPGAAVELLGRRVGGERVAREPAAARELVALCAGLPLAVCVAAARMAARPRQTVAALAGAMTQETGRLEVLQLGGERAVRSALDESYRCLPPATARAYRLLSLPPLTVLTGPLVAAACAVPPSEADRLLDDLAEAHLLEDLGPDDVTRAARFRFHDLVRLHAAQCAQREETAAVRDRTVRRALEWYLATATAARALLSPTHRRLRRDYMFPARPPAFADAGAALRWFDTGRGELMAAVRTAADRGWHSVTWQLVDSLQPLFLRLRPYDLWIEAHRLGLEAARRAGHPQGVSRMLTTGGSGLYNAGQLDEAVVWFTDALQDAKAREDRRAEAQALHGLAQSHRLAGRLPLAESLFAQALALREAIGHDRGAALSRLCLGDIALATDRPRQARSLLTRARTDLLAVPDPYDAARALAFLGRTHAHEAIGDHPTAERLLAQALEEFRATGSLHWQARVLEMLGQTAEDRGDAATARDRYGASLDRYATLSPSDARRLKQRIRNLAPPPATP